MSVDADRVRLVITGLMSSLGVSDASSEHAAEERIAVALGVAAAQFRRWRADPHLTPLDSRLALGIWVESVGRSARVASLSESGRQLREATQFQRAAHMIEGHVLYADQPSAQRTDLVMAHVEAQCRRSPPPPPPAVDEFPLRVMLEELLVRDEQHFAG